MHVLPTQRDVAARLGISQSLVSLALRGSRRVSSDMRQQVVRTAVEMGYLPDPVAAGLSERRWAGRQRPGCHALAWINGRGRRPENSYLPHVRARAHALGYTLIELNADAASDSELVAELARRHIGGVILGEGNDPQVELDWQQHAIVQCGLRPSGTPIPAVRHHIETLLPLAAERLTLGGFRRITVLLCCTPGMLLSELVIEGWHRLCRRRLPGLVGRICPWPQIDSGIDWALGRTSDVILANDPRVLRRLRSAGCSIPCACFAGDATAPGIDLDYAAVGTLVVDHLDGQVRRSSRGLPEMLSTTLVEPRWYDPDGILRR
jgi:LacI family transcriptional regulator